MIQILGKILISEQPDKNKATAIPCIYHLNALFKKYNVLLATRDSSRTKSNSKNIFSIKFKKTFLFYQNRFAENQF
jgi:hypothetical protein